MATAVTNPGSDGLPAGGDIEEGLDEAEFFVTQGLYDDARESLQTLLAAHPNHPLVIERLEELESLMQAQIAPEDDQTFALAEKLAEEVDHVQQASGPQFNDGGEMIDVETVFAQFKKGVDRVISPDDAETHFDLGTAYKEMGLLDDAINEFKISAQNPKKSTLAETMIGLCHMERGDLPAAIECFRRALQSPSKSEREELGLYFELGNAYETAGDLSEALYFLQKVEKRDPQFRGVRQRVQRISARVNSGARQQPGTAEMDDVDRAFDDLLKG
jgi:tetratricopeptide (TPR) repeat protein